MTFTKTASTAAFAKVHTDALEHQQHALGGNFAGIHSLGGAHAVDVQGLGLGLDTLLGSPFGPVHALGNPAFASQYARLPRLVIRTEQLPILQPLPNVLGLPHATYPEGFDGHYNEVLSCEAAILPQAARLWPAGVVHAQSYASLNAPLPLWDPLNVFGVLDNSPVAALGAPYIQRVVLDQARASLELTLAHPAWRSPITSVIAYEAELASADRDLALRRLRYVQALIAARYFQHARLSGLGNEDIEPIGHWLPFKSLFGFGWDEVTPFIRSIHPPHVGSVLVSPEAVIGANGIIAELARAQVFGDITQSEIASLGHDSFYTYPRHITSPDLIALRILDNLHRFIERDDFELAQRLAWPKRSVLAFPGDYDYTFETQTFNQDLSRRLGLFGAWVENDSTLALYGSTIGRDLTQRLVDAGVDPLGVTRAMFAGLFPSGSVHPFYHGGTPLGRLGVLPGYIPTGNLTGRRGQLTHLNSWGGLGNAVDEALVARLIRGGVDRTLAHSLIGETVQRDFAERLVSRGVERSIVDTLILRNIVPVSVEPLYTLDSPIDRIYADRLVAAGISPRVTDRLIGSQLTRDLSLSLQLYGARPQVVKDLILSGLIPQAEYGFARIRNHTLHSNLNRRDIQFRKELVARVKAEYAAQQAATSAATAAATTAAVNSSAATGLPSVGSGIALADGVATPFEGRGTATAHGFAAPTVPTIGHKRGGISKARLALLTDALALSLARSNGFDEPSVHIDTKVATGGDFDPFALGAVTRPFTNGYIAGQIETQLGHNVSLPGAYRDWIHAQAHASTRNPFAINRYANVDIAGEGGLNPVHARALRFGSRL